MGKKSIACRTLHAELARAYANLPLPDKIMRLWDVEWKVQSQNMEDGIIWYLFSVLGTTNKRAVEVSVQSGIECNTANLVLHGGWDVLMFDGSEENRANGLQWYSTHEEVIQPKFVAAWVTVENIEGFVREQGFLGDLDLLSVDIDGIDYWLLQKLLDFVNPRVIVLEYQDILGPNLSVTVPYDPKFSWQKDYGSDYGGASLGAFIKLGKKRGYRFIGCEGLGFNAFLLRNDVGREYFDEVTPQTSGCFDIAKVQKGMKDAYPKVKDLQWQEV